MNKADRKELARAIALLEQAKEIIEAIAEQEQEKYDNLGDNLQQSEKGQAFEENASELDSAQCEISDLIDRVQESIDR